MKEMIEQFQPHSGKIKRWLVCMSVLCFAIGFLQMNFVAGLCGTVFLAFALTIGFVESKYLKKTEEKEVQSF